MSKTTPEQNKRLVLEAFDRLFSKRDYVAAERYWSDATSSTARTLRRPQRSIRTLPDTLKYENR